MMVPVGDSASIATAAAFLVGVLLAIIVYAYEELWEVTADASWGSEDRSRLRKAVDVLFYGGGSGTALYLAHHRFSALGFGAVGYLAVLAAVLVRKYR